MPAAQVSSDASVFKDFFIFIFFRVAKMLRMDDVSAGGVFSFICLTVTSWPCTRVICCTSTMFGNFSVRRTLRSRCRRRRSSFFPSFVPTEGLQVLSGAVGENIGSKSSGRVAELILSSIIRCLDGKFHRLIGVSMMDDCANEYFGSFRLKTSSAGLYDLVLVIGIS